MDWNLANTCRASFSLKNIKEQTMKSYMWLSIKLSTTLLSLGFISSVLLLKAHLWKKLKCLNAENAELIMEKNQCFIFITTLK